MIFLTANKKQISGGKIVASIGLSRAIQKILTGEIKETSDSENIKAKLETKGVYLSRQTWIDLWKGRIFPGKNLKGKFEENLPELYNDWIDWSVNTSRFHTFLRALDIYSSNINSHERAREAKSLLTMIHKEWQPNRFRQISIPSPKKRLVKTIDPILGVTKITANSAIFVGEAKGPKSPLSAIAHESCDSFYNILDPSSVLTYILMYAVKSKLPDKGLFEALTLDFTSAALRIIAYSADTDHP